MEESKEPEKNNSEETTMTEKVRSNPYIAATIVLAIVVLIMIVGSFAGVTGGVITGNAVSEGDVETIFLNYLSKVGANTDYVEVIEVTTEQGLYKISFNYQDEPYPVSYYMTKDASLIGVLSSMTTQEETETSASAEIPKSERPVVDLFIWSYCPYGVQAQAPLAEVAELLSKYADFNAVLYYDGHGAHETQQNKIQACIQKYDAENYWEYAEGFTTDIYSTCSGDIECNEKESVALMKSLGIDSDAIMECVESEGANLISEHSSYAQQLGVSGSPTLVINGVVAQTSRTAEAFKTAICSAFENAPEECSVTLGSTAGTANGNC